jgi:hypothetical protein
VLVALAVVFALSCVVASLVRLAVAVAPTWLDARVLLERLRDAPGAESFNVVARAARAERRAEWEAALIDALEEPPPGREALVNEQLAEVDHRMQRLARVPRVCASLCTSGGFLLAAVSLRSSLGDPAIFAPATREGALRDAVTSAIDVAAVGVCGTAFCIAITMIAKRASRARHGDIDRLVDRLEKLAVPTS